MCNLSLTRSSRHCSRRVTVIVRNSNHSVNNVRRSLTCGRPLMPIIFKLTRYVRSSSVLANKCNISASTSTRLLLGTITKRTGFS